ncbi:hypothetical protein C2845_PM07G09990 [Panicum miliaceum]|uniref:Uncharacterized protein n=1 Tax=Panicum miliaceum TaxID=4540 RepID=A0A3L6SNI2_PANMI|nr:hypothetical protein C2845_PM07G09990 [Panicum miliaceum]
MRAVSSRSAAARCAQRRRAAASASSCRSATAASSASALKRRTLDAWEEASEHLALAASAACSTPVPEPRWPHALRRSRRSWSQSWAEVRAPRRRPGAGLSPVPAPRAYRPPTRGVPPRRQPTGVVPRRCVPCAPPPSHVGLCATRASVPLQLPLPAPPSLPPPLPATQPGAAPPQPQPLPPRAPRTRAAPPQLRPPAPPYAQQPHAALCAAALLPPPPRAQLQQLRPTRSLMLGTVRSTSSSRERRCGMSSRRPFWTPCCSCTRAAGTASCCCWPQALLQAEPPLLVLLPRAGHAGCPLPAAGQAAPATRPPPWAMRTCLHCRLAGLLVLALAQTLEPAGGLLRPWLAGCALPCDALLAVGLPVPHAQLPAACPPLGLLCSPRRPACRESSVSSASVRCEPPRVPCTPSVPRAAAPLLLLPRVRRACCSRLLRVSSAPARAACPRAAPHARVVVAPPALVEPPACAPHPARRSRAGGLAPRSCMPDPPRRGSICASAARSAGAAVGSDRGEG